MRGRKDASHPDGIAGLPAGYPCPAPLPLLHQVLLGQVVVDETMSDSTHEALTQEIIEAQMATKAIRRLDGKPMRPAPVDREAVRRTARKPKPYVEPLLP